MEKNDFFGEFWIPEKPELKYLGKMNTDDTQITHLQINGRFEIDTPSIILGINNKGDKLTLIDNQLTNCEFSKTVECSFKSNTVILSQHFNSLDSIKLKSFNLYFKDLEKWTYFNSIKRDVDVENKTLTITTIDFNEKVLYSNENYSIKIHNKCNWLQNSIPYRDVHLQQSDFFIVELKKELSLEYIQDSILRPFRLFLSFCMSNLTYFDNILAYDTNNESFEIKFRKPNMKRNDNIISANMLLTLSKIGDSFASYYENWINLLEKISPIQYYYFELLEHSSVNYYHNRDFWTITVALESLHRCIYQMDNTEEVEKKHNNNLELLKSKLTAAEFTEISKLILSPSELNLRKRLKFYLDRFEKFSKIFFSTSKSKKSFIQKIIDTRNFQTHLDKNRQYNKANDDDFFDFIWLMMRFFELSILEEIGINEIEAISLFTNYSDFNIFKDSFIKRG